MEDSSLHWSHKMSLSTSYGDRGYQIFSCLLVSLFLAWIMVSLRVYVRAIMIKQLSADDWWMFAALIAYTIYCSVAFYGTTLGGTGKHVTDPTLTLEQTYIGLKGWYICEVIYAPTSALVRTSVALYLLRVAREPLHRWILWADLVVYWMISIMFLCVATFQCDPPSYFYEQVFGAKGKCLPTNVFPDVTYVHSALGALCDLVFATLPIAMLWDVQLNKRTKAVVALLLGMGFVAGIALLVRIPYIRILTISPDFLSGTVDVGIWSAIEPALGIIAGSMATLRPLFKSLRDAKTKRRYGPEYGSVSHSDKRSGPASRRSIRGGFLFPRPFRPATVSSEDVPVELRDKRSSGGWVTLPASDGTERGKMQSLSPAAAKPPKSGILSTTTISISSAEVDRSERHVSISDRWK